MTTTFTLERYSSGPEDTIGRLLNPEGQLLCYTLEDQYRAIKVKGDTRIPAGTYEIKLRTIGGHHLEYLQKFGPAFHHGMLWLQDVPGFQDILIHIGNTDKDTEGCILVGSSPNMTADAQHRRSISGSKDAYVKIYPVLSAPLVKGEQVFLHIVDKG